MVNIARTVSRREKLIIHRGSVLNVSDGLAPKTSVLVNSPTTAQIPESASTESNADNVVLASNGWKKRISQNENGKVLFMVQP